MGRKKRKSKKPEVVSSSSTAPLLSDVPVFEGIVEEVVVTAPSRFPFLVLVLLISILSAFYYLANSDTAALFPGFDNTETLPSVRQQVQEVLKKVRLLRSSSNFKEAYQLLRKMHEKFPEDANLNMELAWHHVQKGTFVFAAEYFELAEKKFPRNSQLNFYRGELHLRWGRKIALSAQGGSIAYGRKLDILSDSSEHLKKSAAFFLDSMEGEFVHNRDAAIEKNKEALEATKPCSGMHFHKFSPF